MDAQELIQTQPSLRLVDTQPSLRMKKVANTDQMEAGPESDPPMPGNSVLGDGVSQNLTPIFTPNLTPLPERERFSGRGKGRKNTFWESIGMLVIVRDTDKWPGGMSFAMQRYYRRSYPEYFTDGKRAAQTRSEKEEKAAMLRSENRPRRRKQDKIS